MSRPTERRIDPYTGRSVLIAPARRGLGGAKPGGLPSPSDRRCPFCPGHEADSEATVARWPADGPWAVRVVSNKYPVVAEGFGDAAGTHEVIIESPAHDADLADFEVPHLRGLLGVWRDRVAALEADEAHAAVMLFRNRGRRAGSSQPHPHGQIAATSWVPFEVALRWERALEHVRKHDEPLGVAELRRERGSARALRFDDDIASYCPWAPSRPFEVRLAPIAPTAFGVAPDATLAALADHLSDAARRIRDRTAITDFNLVLRLPPARASGLAVGWHLELLPRTGGDAGYELTGGEMIVVVTPEDAAARLRQAAGASDRDERSPIPSTEPGA